MVSFFRYIFLHIYFLDEPNVQINVSEKMVSTEPAILQPSPPPSVNSNIAWETVTINDKPYQIDGACVQPYKHVVAHGGRRLCCNRCCERDFFTEKSFLFFYVIHFELKWNPNLVLRNVFSFFLFLYKYNIQYGQFVYAPVYICIKKSFSLCIRMFHNFTFFEIKNAWGFIRLDLGHNEEIKFFCFDYSLFWGCPALPKFDIFGRGEFFLTSAISP